METDLSPLNLLIPSIVYISKKIKNVFPETDNPLLGDLTLEGSRRS